MLKPHLHFPQREDAVLIEQAYKFGWGCLPPETLKDWIGNTELTDAGLEDFVETIDELIQALNDLGRWKFAEEYCDPLEVEIAQQKHQEKT